MIQKDSTYSYDDGTPVQVDDLQRVSQLVNKAYAQSIEGVQSGKIYSEGCWQMEIRTVSFGFNELFLTYEGGDEFNASLHGIITLPGEVHMIQSNIIGFRWDAPVADTDLILITRHKIVQKEDDIIYPPNDPNLKMSE